MNTSYKPEKIMQVKAIYNRGYLEFSVPIRFDREEFPVVVDLPDDVILYENESRNEKSVSSSEERGSDLLTKFKRILGSRHKKRPSSSVHEDKDAYEKAL